jgi:hypothetical protein
MSTVVRRETHHALPVLRGVQVAMLSTGLAGCEAMGELARTMTWAWIGGVVAVLVVVGCLASRMRR